MSHTEQLAHAYAWMQTRRKLINLQGIEQMAEMPAGTMSRFMTSEGRTFPVRRLYDLQRTLVFLGYEPPTPDYRFL